MNIKTLKTLDISSVTIMTTAINVIFSIIFSIIILIVMAIVLPTFIAPIALLIPAIICATIMVTVYKTFIESFLYNLISKKTSISFAFEDDGTISKISTTSTAIVMAIIATVVLLIECIVAMIVLPLALSSLVQTLMLSGQSALAYSLYQVLMSVSNPVIIIMLIVGCFIVTFIYVLIGTYVYNLIAEKGYGVKVGITDNSVLDSIDVKSLAIAIATISLVLGFITGLLSAISSGQYLEMLINAISNFVAGFVCSAIIAIIYNKIAPRVGKIKLELIDE